LAVPSFGVVVQVSIEQRTGVVGRMGSQTQERDKSEDRAKKRFSQK
jgi:hypothetical protein